MSHYWTAAPIAGWIQIYRQEILKLAVIYHRLASSFSDRWRFLSDETLPDQWNDLQATLYGEYRRIMEEEGEAKDDEKEEVEQASK